MTSDDGSPLVSAVLSCGDEYAVNVPTVRDLCVIDNRLLLRIYLVPLVYQSPLACPGSRNKSRSPCLIVVKPSYALIDIKAKDMDSHVQHRLTVHQVS